MCDIPEIPAHLHRQERELIPSFNESESVYRREDQEQSKKFPYSRINLADLSVNRSGPPDGVLSNLDDARHVINLDGSYSFFEGSIAELSLADSGLTNENYLAYTSSYNDGKKEVQVEAQMRIKHDPLECNYSHSVFEFTYEGNIMTTWPKEAANYGKGLGKKSKYVEQLRMQIKDDLSKMIVA